MSNSDEKCCPFCFKFKKQIRLTKKSPKVLPNLYCFDFDHTVINDNSDSAIMSLIRDPIPEDIRNFYNGNNWTEYMDKIMQFVAAQGATIDIIRQRIKDIPFTPGMEALLERIRIARIENPGSKLIIISDANDFFIETSLSHLTPPIVPDLIVSNKSIGTAITHEGGPDHNLDLCYLKIESYENQTICPLCPKNLCKGTALLNYIQKEGPFGYVYYTGDGKNDICAGINLSEKDTLFVRKGYTMDKTIAKGKIMNIDIKIKANIVYWTHASEVQSRMNF